MTGRLVADGEDLCFLPRFAFIDGATYTVVVDGVEVATVVRPKAHHQPTTHVLAVFPTAPVVPRNLLRCYVWFSAPMSEGCAAEHVRLVDEAGAELPGALLPTRHELWDADRRRLTVLLDPARIKRGLVAHRQSGYPLQTGVPFRIAVDAEFRDARGVQLRAAAERRYDVGGDERHRVEPRLWTLTSPFRGTREQLVVAFDRPLDHGLLARCVHVLGEDGRRIAGSARIGAQERSWALAPDAPWEAEAYELVIDPILEDLAGNSLVRVFDRDLTRVADEPRAVEPTVLRFATR
jgi:hypothetical protein